MAKIIGVRFRSAGKIYWFDPKDYEMKPGLHVIVETARGQEYGSVVGGVREIPDDKISQPLKAVVRIATEDDIERVRRNREKEKQAVALCREKIQAHELDMKLIDAEYAFDNSKILFYFTADGRIDFRDLVKDLASVFRTRIELRQIGVRDEAKILGGIGICGRALCCHTWLSDFAPVSIKMAKEQSLSLNPTKISGVCGRLMCCLKNEQETYEYLNSKLPRVGDSVTLPDGRVGTVSSTSVLKQRVKVLVSDTEEDEKEIEEYPVEELTFHQHQRKDKPGKKEGRGTKKEKDGKGFRDGGSRQNRTDGRTENRAENRTESGTEAGTAPQTGDASGEAQSAEGYPDEQPVKKKPRKRRRNRKKNPAGEAGAAESTGNEE